MKKVELIGNIGKIEEKENSKMISVPINERRKIEGGYEEFTTWFNVVLEKTDPTVINVGDLFFIRGNYVINTYLKEDKEPAYSTTIFPSEMRCIFRKPEKREDGKAE